MSLHNRSDDGASFGGRLDINHVAKCNNLRIAVVGSGISGLSAAYALAPSHRVVLFEKESRLGGHSRTIDLKVGDRVGESQLAVDTGFIVMNDRNYPLLTRLFDRLGVERTKTDMSFSVSVAHLNGMVCSNRHEWAGSSLNTLFAQRKNIANLPMLRGLWDVFRFNRNAMRVVQDLPDLTLGQLLDLLRLGAWFRDYYLLPMGGAIWSSPTNDMLDFPAASFVRFFDQHGLLSLNNRPQWYTLVGRSRDYVRAIERAISPAVSIRYSEKTLKIRRVPAHQSLQTLGINEQIQIKTNSGVELFDQLVFACHPIEILEMLDDPNPEELSVLSLFSRQKNAVITHCDTKLMPANRLCWSSWNHLAVRTDRTDDVNKSQHVVSYWMNKLQHIDMKHPVFVTLNPSQELSVEPSCIYDECEFYHPLFDAKTPLAQSLIQQQQGRHALWFCGAYLRYGFHEDGIWSTEHMLNQMGVNPLWSAA